MSAADTQSLLWPDVRKGAIRSRRVAAISASAVAAAMQKAAGSAQKPAAEDLAVATTCVL